ncbi:hypothetical protein BD310DRAFT_961760 [Dichomitus squalens]|uniref:BTB domain-containing protein n=1 Tax=Dichomitus squalens TaxID=114155 RepID=A0A4Q9PFS8_9APHY|nr:hypothetical protein BD310DRAFT_961760 [Dichomitus squalens]
MEEPSRKRFRINDDSAHPVPMTAFDKVQAAARDSEYWFDDGNLILLSQGFAFCIYKGLLAEHSSVFRSMFQVATPATEELVDGCPVVTLYDSPNDLRELFRLIYPLNSTLRLVGRNVDITFISAIIRLDHKYELRGMYEQAMSYLTTYYTTNFDAWADGRNATDWQPKPIDAIGAVNLARLTNTTAILPSAFYICATLGPDLARGMKREDGSVERLSPEDMVLCLQMKERLATENAHTAFLLFRPAGAQNCSNPSGHSYCAELWRKLLEYSGLSKAPHPVASSRALDSWVENADSIPASAVQPTPMGPYMLSFSSPSRALCKGCRNHLQTRDREFRRQIWRKLPEFVGLTIENWDTPAA